MNNKHLKLCGVLLAILLVLIITNCEKSSDEIIEDSEQQHQIETVDYKSLPSTVFKAIPGINPNSSRKFSEYESALLIDWDEILKMVDTTYVTSYAIKFRIKGDPESVASFIGYHITVHIDCDHWWTLAEARILQVGFAITESEIRDCQNLTPLMKDELVHDLAYRN